MSPSIDDPDNPPTLISFAADFTTLSQWDHSAGDTGLWNPVDQRIQAAVSANGVVNINFGTGSDGTFNDGPAQTGITIVGNTITIDTDTKAIFNFSSFNLSNGKTLRTTGSQPLTIRVLGPATLAGTIDVSGGPSANGADNTITATAAPGGTGVASGRTGGSAGFGFASPTQATSGLPGAGADVRGGAFGANTAMSGNDAGGGGGCNGTNGAAPDAVGNNAKNGAFGSGQGLAGPCTTTRSNLAAAFETTFTGGAGGGGGGGYTGGDGPVSGAGGGAGGGAFHFVALAPISFGVTPNTGQILANGGTGGSNNNDINFQDCGGSGGGGSGGSIWLQTKSTIGAVSDPGSVNVSGGNGGTILDVNCAATGNGGDGSMGIVRLDSTSANVNGSSLVFSNSPAILSGQSYVITSKAIDTGITLPNYYTPTETQDTTSSGCGSTGTLSVAYQGSTDGTTFGAGVSAAQISNLNGNRYIRFQVTITTSGATPPCLSGLSFNYSES